MLVCWYIYDSVVVCWLNIYIDGISHSIWYPFTTKCSNYGNKIIVSMLLDERYGKYGLLQILDTAYMKLSLLLSIIKLIATY